MMTEEEYDLRNIKSAVRQKYILGISILLFVLTSFYVAPFVGSIIFLVNIVGSLFLGILLASNLIGSSFAHQTALDWIFSLNLSLVFVFVFIVSDRLIDKVFIEDGSFMPKLLLAANSISFIMAIESGIFISFNDEIVRITKLIRFSKPEKRNILSIRDPEIIQN